MVTQTVSYYEDVVEAEYSQHGNVVVQYSRSYSFTRSLVNNKWVMGKVSDISKVTKEFEPCSSYIHPSVKSWGKSVVLENVSVDVKVIIKKVKRTISTECVEEKVVNYVNYGDLKFGYTGDPSDILSVIDYLKSNVVEGRPKKLLSNGGRVTFIVDPEIVSHIFHYIVNLLNGDNPRLKLNEKVFGDITLYDNPLNSFSPAFSFFDDEGVKTKKRELIGDGIIQSYLGSMTSKFGEAGNGRGLLPRPDYFTLEMKQGDWRVEELIEESRGSYIVYGVKRSDFIENSIRITPRRVEKIGEGEVFLREIAIPVQDLISIDAVTRERKEATVDDNHGSLMPFIRTKARAILY